jgi:hypothetical protein
MTSRQIRRAAERNQMKLSNRNGFSSAPSNVSPAQLAANRPNSQLSTGPATPEGKAKASLNAVKTGLTGRTVLLPSDDAAAYEKHILDWFEELRPVGPRECALAQSLADNAWHVRRLPALEMAIFALGRQQFAAQFKHEAPALQPGLIELHTYLTYEKQLKNLHLQEARLRRQHEKDTAALRQLQQQRLQKETERLEVAQPPQRATGPITRSPHRSDGSTQIGFEFATPDLEPAPEPVRPANSPIPTPNTQPEHAQPRANAA